ncbi:metal ABC transporter ATP-binding protein [Terrisporobacter sp.]
MKNIISIENMSFSYSNENILDNIILSIDEGDFVGIFGCNGSGKSTLMKLLIGQLSPSSGKIKLFNEELSKSNKLNQVGYVPQVSLSSERTFPATVEEIVMTNLYSKIGFMKFPKKEHKEKVKEALKKVNMDKYSKRLIGNLSGGQQQRVMIAKALVSDPKILILDEPTTGIDATSEEQLYGLLNKLNKESKITIIIVSHDFAKISNYTNKIFSVENNKVSLINNKNEV